MHSGLVFTIWSPMGHKESNSGCVGSNILVSKDEVRIERLISVHNEAMVTKWPHHTSFEFWQRKWRNFKQSQYLYSSRCLVGFSQLPIYLVTIVPMKSHVISILEIMAAQSQQKWAKLTNVLSYNKWYKPK